MLNERAIGDATERPILPWRLVGGAFLHFVVPVYLVALVLNALLAVPHGVGAEALLDDALPFSAHFLGGYALIGLTATLAAAMVDPFLRRGRARRQAEAPDAAPRRSEAQVARALVEGRGRFGPTGDAALAVIAARRWDHADPQMQALARDLDEVVGASSIALASAAQERRAAILAMTIGSLQRIDGALVELASRKGLQDEHQAMAVARYVEIRYGASDFAGGGD